MIMAVLALLGFSSCNNGDEPIVEEITTAVGDWELLNEEVYNYSTGYHRLEPLFVSVSFYKDNTLIIDSLAYYNFTEIKDSLFVDNGTTPINIRGRWAKTRTKNTLNLYFESKGAVIITRELNFILK